jgi:hypothetical protein
MPVLLTLTELEAKRVAGDMTREILRELDRAAETVRLHFHRFGCEPTITCSIDKPRPWFRFEIGWARGIAQDEHWDHVFTITLESILQIRRTMAGDYGLQIAERMWNELVQFENRAYARGAA